MSDLSRLLLAIGAEDRSAVLALLDASPALATAGLTRDEEFLLAARGAQVYAAAKAEPAAIIELLDRAPS